MFRVSSQCIGILVDWLELLSPEIIEGPTVSQLDLLFGRPASDVGRVTTRQLPTSSSYLLALLAHQSSWANIRATLVRLLESHASVERYGMHSGFVSGYSYGEWHFWAPTN